MIYSEEAKKIYNDVCDKYKHHWLDTTISKTMAMEMINKALNPISVNHEREQFYCHNKDFDKDDNNCQKQCDMCRYLDTGKLQELTTVGCCKEQLISFGEYLKERDIITTKKENIPVRVDLFLKRS